MGTKEEMRIEALEGAERWSVAVLRQLERVDAAHAEVYPRRPIVHYGKAERLPFVRLGIESRFCLFAAANLLQVRDYLEELTEPGAVPSLSPESTKRVRTLRDCFTHWDERYHDARQRKASPISGKAFRDFKTSFPGEDSESHEWNATDTHVGGLSLLELGEWAQAMDRFVDDLNDSHFVWRGWPGR